MPIKSPMLFDAATGVAGIEGLALPAKFPSASPATALTPAASTSARAARSATPANSATLREQQNSPAAWPALRSGPQHRDRVGDASPPPSQAAAGPKPPASRFALGPHTMPPPARSRRPTGRFRAGSTPCWLMASHVTPVTCLRSERSARPILHGPAPGPVPGPAARFA
jgi:hypothetical protein